MCQQTECVGVTFKVYDIGPLAGMGGKLGLKRLPLSFGEIGRNGLLARMTERRIAHVVSQTGCRYYITYLGYVGVGQFRVLSDDTA